MKKFALLSFAAALIAAIGFAPAFAEKTAAELEKEKALANPYAEDLGPQELDVSKYPKPIQAGYEMMLKRCTVCHDSARPLNSSYAQPFTKLKGKEGSDDLKKQVAGLKKTKADLFTDINVLKIEDSIWKRFVKRMMAKPGCNITKKEGGQIYKFLAYDSAQRKIENSETWKTHRKKLLSEFKEKHPKRYAELYEKKKDGK